MSEALVKATGLYKYYVSKNKKKTIKAVDGVDITIPAKSIVSLVGESGSGKTTLGKILLGLETPTKGKVMFQDMDIFSSKNSRKHLLGKVQTIFQDPFSAVNPRMRVFDIVAEPLRLLKKKSEIRRDVIYQALRDANLTPPELYAKQYPHQLSGGQLQRVTIARAIITHPLFIVADEPASMLDASIRTGILNLILDLREKYNITFLFITHDITQALYVSDYIYIMYLGKILEEGPAEEVILNPLNGYTYSLLNAMTEKENPIEIKGEVPSPENIPKGCRFHPRCRFATEICKKEEPELILVNKNHKTRCHNWEKFKGE